MKQLVARLWAHYSVYHAEGPPRLRYMGMVGVAGTVLFYFLRFTRPNPSLWDDIALRGLSLLLYGGLALERFWPLRWRKHYVAYSYVALLLCLPFFGVLVVLQRGGGMSSISNLFIMVSFLVLLTDWRNTLAMLAAGIGMAAAVYMATDPDPAVPQDVLRQIPAYLLILVGGGLFKLSTERIEVQRSLRGTQALAGSIAHEMRIPLAQVRHSLERIGAQMEAAAAAGRLPAEVARDTGGHVRQGEQAVRRGLQVISMTLDEVNARPPDKSTFSWLSAAEASRKAVREYVHETDEARRRVHVRVMRDFHFLGDETAYLFLLFNLFKNALYYLPLCPDMQVEVVVDGCEVTVCDSGPGIRPDVLSRLFQPFATDKDGGSGLGLPYCMRVMRAFGGSITCRSEPGKFTRFRLQFPAAKRPAPAQPAPTAQHRASAAAAGRVVLLVEDSAMARRVVVSYLREAGIQVIEAGHGEQALERLASMPRCDLVLMDIDMPGMDGLQATRRLRAGPARTRRVPVIALSAHSGAAMVEQAHAAGMDDFLVKPADGPGLRAMLASWLDSHTPPEADEAARAATRTATADGVPLLNRPRLEYFRQRELLDELLADYVPQLELLLQQLEGCLCPPGRSLSGADAEARRLLHSLLGVSGDMGAMALHAHFRTVYQGVQDAGRWPESDAWLLRARALARQSLAALEQWRR